MYVSKRKSETKINNIFYIYRKEIGIDFDSIISRRRREKVNILELRQHYIQKID